MNKVIIRELQVPAVVGVYAHEQSITQTLLVTLSYTLSSPLLETCVTSDNIDDTIDYAKIRQAILEFAASAHFLLLETFTYRLAQQLKMQFPFESICVSVTKTPLSLVDVEGITVEIEL